MINVSSSGIDLCGGVTLSSVLLFPIDVHLHVVLINTHCTLRKKGIVSYCHNFALKSSLWLFTEAV